MGHHTNDQQGTGQWSECHRQILSWPSTRSAPAALAACLANGMAPRAHELATLLDQPASADGAGGRTRVAGLLLLGRDRYLRGIHGRSSCRHRGITSRHHDRRDVCHPKELQGIRKVHDSSGSRLFHFPREEGEAAAEPLHSPQITVGSAGASLWAASTWSGEALDLLSATPGHCCCRFCCARKSSGRTFEVPGSSRAAAADRSQEA